MLLMLARKHIVLKLTEGDKHLILNDIIQYFEHHGTFSTGSTISCLTSAVSGKEYPSISSATGLNSVFVSAISTDAAFILESSAVFNNFMLSSQAEAVSLVSHWELTFFLRAVFFLIFLSEAFLK